MSRRSTHGSYLSQWRRRNALKMWTGWPTFPMVFVKGTLIGGYDERAKLIAGGELEGNARLRSVDGGAPPVGDNEGLSS
jgi:glutaredoxin-related protein